MPSAFLLLLGCGAFELTPLEALGSSGVRTLCNQICRGHTQDAQQSWFRKQGAGPRADWADVKLEIMECADWEKFSQHPALAEMLLATHSAELIEDSPVDSF